MEYIQVQLATCWRDHCDTSDPITQTFWVTLGVLLFYIYLSIYLSIYLARTPSHTTANCLGRVFLSSSFWDQMYRFTHVRPCYVRPGDSETQIYQFWCSLPGCCHWSTLARRHVIFVSFSGTRALKAVTHRSVITACGHVYQSVGDRAIFRSDPWNQRRVYPLSVFWHCQPCEPGRTAVHFGYGCSSFMRSSGVPVFGSSTLIREKNLKQKWLSAFRTKIIIIMWGF